VNLQIRDPRAHALARKLAEERGISMTDAVIEALAAELKRARDQRPLAERLAAIASGLRAKSRGPGHRMDKTEIDDMWGQ
jgi:antitoxin VapB